MTELQLWGGLECTVNRTAAGYLDQTVLSGHHDRIADLDLFADLGLKAIRYPVLWERTAPDGPDSADWRWPDERLARLRALAIRPIVGLVHHGSGPQHTHLLDDEFAPGLAQFAGQVAARYPWVTDWTPVNEPLTTARFSALYGHWYPHARDEWSFWLALLNQVDGTRLAMRAVRAVNREARLIQTDDIGRSYSTLPLADQAAFDNVRRWAGWDLLFGRVVPRHPLWDRFVDFGFEARVRAIADDPCPPDIVGVNHYLTSDRFLDHRTGRYPVHTHGGNGREPFADVEAVRVLDPAPAGLAGVLREVWQRYRAPIAITEVHNGCTREEQLRWAAQAWDTAAAARAEGVDCRAVTAWALLGSHGWNTLLTAPGRYEPGVFDAVDPVPRPTALAVLWRGLPHGAGRHPAAAGPGWWERPDRLRFGARPCAGGISTPARPARAAPLLIVGARGLLGEAVVRACGARDLPVVLAEQVAGGTTRSGVSTRTLDANVPWAIVDARLPGDEEHREVGVEGADAIALARLCADRDLPCLSFVEAQGRDRFGHGPGLVAGTSSVDGMSFTDIGCSRSLVIHASSLFSPDHPGNFAMAVVRRLEAGLHFPASLQEMAAPTHAPRLVSAALDLLIDGVEGAWHLGHGEELSWAEFARRIARDCGLDDRLVEPVHLARRSASSSHQSVSGRRWRSIGPLDEAIAHFATYRPRSGALVHAA